MIRALMTAGRIGFILHGDHVVENLLKYGARLALKAHDANREAAEDMVELMRSRVPVDTGNLYNGIIATEDGDTFVVEASAIRGTFDYARVVEFGRDDMLAEPFFLDSADDVLGTRRHRMDDGIGAAAREVGL